MGFEVATYVRPTVSQNQFGDVFLGLSFLDFRCVCNLPCFTFICFLMVKQKTNIYGSFSFVLLPGFVGGLRKQKQRTKTQTRQMRPPGLGKTPFDAVFRD